MTNVGSAVIYGPSGWGRPISIDHPNDLTSVSCWSSVSCVAVDNLGNSFLYDGVSDTWSSTDSVDPNGGGLNGVSCDPGGACEALDVVGNAVEL